MADLPDGTWHAQPCADQATGIQTGRQPGPWPWQRDESQIQNKRSKGMDSTGCNVGLTSVVCPSGLAGDAAVQHRSFAFAPRASSLGLSPECGKVMPSGGPASPRFFSQLAAFSLVKDVRRLPPSAFTRHSRSPAF